MYCKTILYANKYVLHYVYQIILSQVEERNKRAARARESTSFEPLFFVFDHVIRAAKEEKGASAWHANTTALAKFHEQTMVVTNQSEYKE